ncbi:DUF1801 domain-containing protein [Sphingomonas sp. LY29]|uniref:DUF1801 domain-containing protein n=1 Tax=Sphingomonas sp. LY29 TaxID=3095341 RepID=UPI002D773B02|nr:DUF1801 domain-containing protein [Sphingomonas sp. LY29]WRP25228.1 DUF1801 domain-containing protein [Sphingomonas sp. LY29]
MVSSKAATVADYLAELDPDRRVEIERVRALVNDAIPPGYDERMAWGMICWDVPLAVSGPTYNGQPLAYVALAAQKNANSLYLNCAYSSAERTERLKVVAADAGKKLDMGKSCLRFKRADDLPLDAINEEIASATPQQFVAIAEAARAR